MLSLIKDGFRNWRRDVLSNYSGKPEKDGGGARPRKAEPFLEPTPESNQSSFIKSPSYDESSATQTQASESKILNGANTTASSIISGSKSESRKNSSRKQQQSSGSSSSSITAVNNASNTRSKSAVGRGNSNSNARKIANEKGKSDSLASSVSVNASSSPAAADKEEELIAYLNSNEPTDLSESLILKGEVESQARELKLLTVNYRSLQRDYDELKRKMVEADVESSRQSNKAAKEEDVQKLLEERDKEISSLSSRHEQALEALRKLELSQENVLKLEQSLLENSQLKSENNDLLQRMEMISQKVETGENHVLSLKSTLSSMEKEFSNYKDKAKSILNYKDELISSLKSEGGSAPHADSNSNTAEELLAEVTALKNERELLHADLSQTRTVVESFKEDNNRLEKEIGTLRYYSEDLTNNLKREKETVSNLQNENLQICQQLTSLQFDLEREKNERRKNEELVNQYKKNLLTQPHQSSSSNQNGYLSNGSSSGVSNSEKEVLKLKTRLSALSQSLLEKQSLINDISTDKQLLQIEVERLKNELRDCRIESNEYGGVSGLPQTVIASQPLYLSESPWDSRVSARMKRMYTQLDAVFCQFGLALRRRPNLRFGMSIYVIFLHLWVFFVLFSWMHHTVPDPDTQANASFNRMTMTKEK